MTEDYPVRRRVVLASGLVVSLCAAGCGSSAPPAVSGSAEQAKVHGTVKVRGKSATKGTVSFNPANSERRSAPTATAEIGKDGGYLLDTLVGGNSVTVRTPETVKDPKLNYFSKQVEVSSGDNTVDIEVPAPSGR